MKSFSHHNTMDVLFSKDRLFEYKVLYRAHFQGDKAKKPSPLIFKQGRDTNVSSAVAQVFVEVCCRQTDRFSKLVRTPIYLMK